MSTILIVENNKDFAYVIRWYFASKGYTVFSSMTGEEALKIYESEIPDIILLDISLDGELNGKDVARKIRSKDKSTPIIFMSGENNSPADVVDAFGVGGNYFLKKPVSIEELEVHIQSALKVHIPVSTYTVGPVVFNVRERMLTKNGIQDSLTEKETLVLQILVEYINTTVDSTAILQSAWGSDDKEESLRNTISALRKKLDASPVTIETVKGRGYRLNFEE
jgi:DNA-binding response OmpR family regulator